jgi:hypothetical protein
MLLTFIGLLIFSVCIRIYVVYQTLNLIFSVVVEPWSGESVFLGHN